MQRAFGTSDGGPPPPLKAGPARWRPRSSPAGHVSGPEAVVFAARNSCVCTLGFRARPPSGDDGRLAENLLQGLPPTPCPAQATPTGNGDGHGPRSPRSTTDSAPSAQSRPARPPSPPNSRDATCGHPAVVPHAREPGRRTPNRDPPPGRRPPRGSPARTGPSTRPGPAGNRSPTTPVHPLAQLSTRASRRGSPGRHGGRPLPPVGHGRLPTGNGQEGRRSSAHGHPGVAVWPDLGRRAPRGGPKEQGPGPSSPTCTPQQVALVGARGPGRHHDRRQLTMTATSSEKGIRLRCRRRRRPTVVRWCGAIRAVSHRPAG